MKRILGFSGKSMRWIQGYLESSYVFVLINESSKKKIISKGFREGDPFTPFLFIMIGQGLTNLMREVVKKVISRLEKHNVKLTLL